MTLFLALDAPLLPPHRLSPREVWLSPNAREKPPSDPPGVFRIARKFPLKNSVLRDGAISRNGRLKVTMSAAADHDPSAGPLVAMIRIPAVYPGWRTKVRSCGDDALAAVGLDAND
jgi:hypothetical protein